MAAQKQLATPTAAADLQAAQLELEQLRTQLTAERVEIQRLQEQLALRDSALDAAPSHFIVSKFVDQSESVVIYVNRAMAASHGYSKEEMLGKSVKMFSPVDWTSERFHQLRANVMQGKPTQAEGTIRRKDGSTFVVGCTIVPVFNAEGRLTHTMSFGADITRKLEDERKKRELQDQLHNEMRERERILIELRLAQKLESVGRLAAGIAHEINTPIQYVGDSLHFLRSAFEDLDGLLTTYQQVAEAGIADAATLETLEQAKVKADIDFLRTEIPKAFDRTFDGAQRVSHIVRAMKEFSHPDANELSSSDINHALQTTLTVAMNEYKYLATVRTQFAELPPVMCNVSELNQVFLNLIVNSAHAIQDSGKDISNGEIFVGSAVNGEFVEVTIGDNGCGIPEENLEKIYDPFFTTKDVGRGTGQGLAIARSIVVDKHGGDIRVKTLLGVGTQFILRLPIDGPKRAET